MDDVRLGTAPDPSLLAWIEMAGDEAILPAGIRLTDETRTGRQCFVLLEGTATVEAAGNQIRRLRAGAFVGSADQAGRPRAPAGVTIRTATCSRVLVIDADRLGVLVDTDPSAAAAWRDIVRRASPASSGA